MRAAGTFCEPLDRRNNGPQMLFFEDATLTFLGLGSIFDIQRPHGWGPSAFGSTRQRRRDKKEKKGVILARGRAA